MLRILCILSLALIIGAHKHDSWKQDLKNLFETLTREINQSLKKSLSDFPEVRTANSFTESSSTAPCESDCRMDSSTSKATAESASKPETLDDYTLNRSPESPLQQHKVGSLKGTPGENFPDYTDIPTTSFSCSDQDYVPGFYADLESRCQVFHACWPHRRESFLCPVGTTFNQALLACDYWYSSNCSLAPHYYNVNSYSLKYAGTNDTPEGSMIDDLLGTGQESSKEELQKIVTSEPDAMAFISQFLPVKAKITIYPETSNSKSKIVATASVGKRKKRHHSITESPDYTEEPQSTAESVIAEEAQDYTEEPQSTTQSVIAEEAQDYTEEPQSTIESVIVKEAQFSTRSPDCTETVKYINVEAAVKLVFDRLDNVIKNIIREIKNFKAANEAKVCNTAHTDKISVISKIKHKLIPKPLMPPVIKEPTITSKTDDAVDSSATKPPKADLHKKPVDYRIKYPILSISPLTKKALIESYINLLKLKRSKF